MRFVIPDNFNEFMINEIFVNKLLLRAELSIYDKEYFGYLFLDYIFLDGKIKFKKDLNVDYLNKVKKFLHFWINSYVLTLNQKELFCGYILSFIAVKENINYKKKLKKIRNLIWN